MATEILVPTLGESVSSATVARWLKKAGEAVAADEPLVELETDKVTVEVNAPAAGVIEAIAAQRGRARSRPAACSAPSPRAAPPPRPRAAAPKPAAAPAAQPQGGGAARRRRPGRHPRRPPATPRPPMRRCPPRRR